MQFFLQIPKEDFYFASSSGVNEKRLYHGSLQQEERFALYFSNKISVDDQPFMLEVTISGLNVEPNPTKVVAQVNNMQSIEYLVPENSLNTLYHQKICDILNAHPFWKSINP